MKEKTEREIRKILSERLKRPKIRFNQDENVKREKAPRGAKKKGEEKEGENLQDPAWSSLDPLLDGPAIRRTAGSLSGCFLSCLCLHPTHAGDESVQRAGEQIRIINREKSDHLEAHEALACFRDPGARRDPPRMRRRVRYQRLSVLTQPGAGSSAISREVVISAASSRGWPLASPQSTTLP